MKWHVVVAMPGYLADSEDDITCFQTLQGAREYALTESNRLIEEGHAGKYSVSLGPCEEDCEDSIA